MKKHKKYNSAKDFLQDTTLSMQEIDETLLDYIEEKGLSYDKFWETEEGKEIMEWSAYVRFATYM